MGDYGRIGDGVMEFIVFLMVLGVFGLWKIGELVYWVATHVRVQIQ